MVVGQHFILQLEEGGEWKEVAKSYEYESLICAGMLRREEKGEICRVLDKEGNIFWHAKGAPIAEDAPQNG